MKYMHYMWEGRAMVKHYYDSLRMRIFEFSVLLMLLFQKLYNATIKNTLKSWFFLQLFFTTKIVMCRWCHNSDTLFLAHLMLMTSDKYWNKFGRFLNSWPPYNLLIKIDPQTLVYNMKYTCEDVNKGFLIKPGVQISPWIHPIFLIYFHSFVI